MYEYLTILFFQFSVSASSQNVPEAIQKWHESSKFLEQNQTALSTSIYEIKMRIDKIEKDVSIVYTIISYISLSYRHVLFLTLIKFFA